MSVICVVFGVYNELHKRFLTTALNNTGSSWKYSTTAATGHGVFLENVRMT